MADLILFDLDGTLIRSFLREGAPRTPANYALVEFLPGRRHRLRALEFAGTKIAFVTNQGGVAFGYQTREQVERKLCSINHALGEGGRRLIGRMLSCSRDRERILPALFYVAYSHPNASIERYKADDYWRKPGPGMVRRAMRDYRVEPERTLFVGDMDTDRECAARAGVAYVDAEEFFV